MTWSTVAQFTNAITAQIARGRLEAEGIETFIVGENFMWSYSHAVGTVRLQVPSAQKDDAIAVLRELDNGAYSIVED